jgi:hypothetical protein
MNRHQGSTSWAMILIAIVVGMVASTVIACGRGPTGSKTDAQTSETPSTGTPSASASAQRIDPSTFTTKIDNPFYPLQPGTRWVWQGPNDEGKSERTVIDVTHETRRIMGVTCVVIHDTVSVAGKITEDTFDWYAQDAEGNVWYFGEDTKEYENGKVVSTKGTWEAGVNGAEAGIIMKAKPKVGDSYRQEYYKGEAEDFAEVLAVDQRVTVPFGTFQNVLQTKETTPLEPDLVENKYYVRGVGVVREVTLAGGSGHKDLIEMTHR